MIEADRITPNSTKFYDSEYFNSEMYFKGEWEYLNNPLSKEFLVLQLNMSIYLDRNHQHIDYYNILRERANRLSKIIQEELTEKSN